MCQKKSLLCILGMSRHSSVVMPGNLLGVSGKPKHRQQEGKEFKTVVCMF